MDYKFQKFLIQEILIWHNNQTYQVTNMFCQDLQNQTACSRQSNEPLIHQIGREVSNHFVPKTVMKVKMCRLLQRIHTNISEIHI